MSTPFNPKWLEPRAVVPVDIETTAALLNTVKNLMRTEEQWQAGCEKSDAKVEELMALLREINEWARPMQDGTRGNVPDWFFKLRKDLQ